MLRALDVVTSAGTTLKGNIFKSPGAKTVVIVITGVEGNIHNNPFYTIIGKRLAQQNVDFIVAHTRDAFNKVTAFNKRTGAKEVYGAYDEDFRRSDEDVAAYLDYARKMGYQHIVLGGQSFGANKVIHYLANHQESAVDRFLLMSPVDLKVLRKCVTNRQRQLINEQLASGKEKQILPFRLFRWLTSTAGNAQRWLTDDTLNNVHSDQNGDYTQLANVNYTGVLLIGTYDRFAGNSPKNYLENINDHLPYSTDNKLIYIQNAGHIYRHQEDKVAQVIENLLQQWSLLGK
ncbi:DUF1749 domain-containing protein [uncultured Limosilactobacillus sp.]|uniref:alpha/beta hydrolase n=1 Tax=uncultured Limosilactobacillus sp. TaxID=2837629 RepID=UPI0025EDA124|nr:DUF1749 domain-containing protein [uncultured Limosilactobacillus sp.]